MAEEKSQTKYEKMVDEGKDRMKHQDNPDNVKIFQPVYGPQGEQPQPPQPKTQIPETDKE